MAENTQIKDRSYLGKGIIYMGLYPSGPLLPVGNCSALNISITEDKKELPNHMDAGGGNRNEVSRIQNVNVSITAHDLSARNLAMATRGTTKLQEPVAVVGEAHTAYPSALVDLEWIPDPETLVVRSTDSSTTEVEDEEVTVPVGGLIEPAQPLTSGLVVKNNAGDTTYNEGTDYEITQDNKIQVLPGGDISESDTLKISYLSASGTVYQQGTEYEVTPVGLRILGGQLSEEKAIKIDYTPVPQHNLEALTEAGQEYRLVFDGLNEAQSGKPAKVKAHRFKPSPTDGLNWIGDDFAEMTIQGGLLSDSSINAQGASRFFRVQMAD